MQTTCLLAPINAHHTSHAHLLKMDSPQILPSDKDNFNGVIIKPAHYGPQISAEEFERRLSASIAAYKESGKRGVWLTIPISQAELISVAAKVLLVASKTGTRVGVGATKNFKFHHSKPDQVTMTRWLPEDEASTIPIYATHNIGVGGFVVNDKNQLLVVQEKWLRGIKIAHWKLPGGVAEHGENLWETAIRETEEETGIRTEFVSLLCFRQMHQYNWGIDDMYFACLLRPLNTDIHVNPSEIADAKWMDIDEYISDHNTFPGNVFIAEAFKKGIQNGLMIRPAVYPHFLRTKPDLSMYEVCPCDATRPCDLSTKQWAWTIGEEVQKKLAAASNDKDKPKANI